MALKRWWQQAKNIYHWFQAQGWRAVYGWPDRGLTIIGITGTNGKTTTSYIMANILRAAYGADKVGLLTTIVFWFGQTEEINKSKMTTLQSHQVFQYLKRMKEHGVTHVVLEITSHALDQYRLSGIQLDGAIILNLSREHLDYHQTMEQYAAAKQKIINYLKPNAPLVAKKDDDWVRTMKLPPNTIWLTTAEAQAVQTLLKGEVNKENVLAATLLSHALHVPAAAIEQGVTSVKAVPGRMEWVTSPMGIKVLIDYAVTPDALERLYKTAKEEVGNHTLYGVLGACGLRDRGKRPHMARVVRKYVNQLILTREDPWTEPEEQIFSDLEQGLEAGEKNTAWQRITDRREALRHVLQLAKPGDIVVVTGKGAERGMAIGKKIVPWHERTVVEELFKELNL
jgi:UDP-N-acetylmuramoyl-L-alanyl-D-glutamate--2,6-diaminopimelate ligase